MELGKKPTATEAQRVVVVDELKAVAIVPCALFRMYWSLPVTPNRLCDQVEVFPCHSVSCVAVLCTGSACAVASERSTGFRDCTQTRYALRWLCT
jgi:hypothetical protein